MATISGPTTISTGGTITNVASPAVSNVLYTNNINAHTHTISPATTRHSANNVTISNGNINAYSNASGGSRGDMKFTPDGNIMAYDGTRWVMVAGLDDTETQVNQIKRELCENFPDAAFDLMLKGLL